MTKPITQQINYLGLKLVVGSKVFCGPQILLGRSLPLKVQSKNAHKIHVLLKPSGAVDTYWHRLGKRDFLPSEMQEHGGVWRGAVKVLCDGKSQSRNRGGFCSALFTTIAFSHE